MKSGNRYPAVCGVDEAGKGAVFGPLVVAAVGCGSPEECSGLGLRDSKELTRLQRERLYTVITERFEIAVKVIPPEEIDRIRQRMSLNLCVAMAHAEVIQRLNSRTAYVDACDVNAMRYGLTVHTYLDIMPEVTVLSEHGADKKYPIVSAASIIAKVNRDWAIDRLREEHGEIGSGYPSDPTTIAFLEDYISRKGVAPPFARKTWKTVTNIYDRESQSTLPW